MAHAASKDKRARAEGELQGYLAETGPLAVKAGHALWDLGHYYGMAACDAYFQNRAADAACFLTWAVHLRSLRFRWDGMHSRMHPERGNWPTEYWDSMRAAGPLMLSCWASASACASCFLEMAEKDQRLNTLPQSRRIAHNTNDVFLIELFSNGLGIATSYRSTVPLVPAYQRLIAAWRSTDNASFSAAMATAADFHIARAKHSTGSVFYEFDDYFDRLFPAELLAVQALRQKEGLPAFETGHLLIDAPWAFIQKMPSIAPHPLAVVIEERLKEHYPRFR
jgi:hypothetical protein